jgi:hypothetical protein
LPKDRAQRRSANFERLVVDQSQYTNRTHAARQGASRKSESEQNLAFFAPRTRTDSAPGITKLEYLILNHLHDRLGRRSHDRLGRRSP